MSILCFSFILISSSSIVRLLLLFRGTQGDDAAKTASDDDATARLGILQGLVPACAATLYFTFKSSLKLPESDDSFDDDELDSLS
jgi:hypothetical protein